MRQADPNLTLVKLMGSKRGYDPMPPDQYEWQRAEGEPPLYRLWSWLCGHTVRQGHRSPYAVNEKGKPLALRDAAKALELDKGFVSNLWARGEAAGLWHREGPALHLNGGVTITQVEEANRRRTEVECTLNLTEAELLKIKDWPKATQLQFHALWGPAQSFRSRLEAHKIAEARAACDEIEDNIRREFALEKTRLPKRRPDVVELPQLLLPFVHSTPVGVSVQPTSVERTNGESGGENESVRTALSLLPTKTEQRADPAAANSVLKDDVEELARLLQIDAAAAASLLFETRKTEATITPRVIAHLASIKLRQNRNGKVTNPTGLLLRSVPAMASGATLAAATSDAVKEINHERLRALDMISFLEGEPGEANRLECERLVKVVATLDAARLRILPELAKGATA